MRWWLLGWLASGWLFLAAGCTSKPRRAAMVVEPQVALSSDDLPAGVEYLDPNGACAGVFMARGGSMAGVWVEARRDVDGDGAEDVVIADRRMCDERNNCQWQLYRGGLPASGDGGAGCPQFAGAVDGQALAVVDNDEKPRRLQGIWRLEADRVLRHEYRLIAGIYQLTSVSMCRIEAERVICSTPSDDAH